MSYGTGFVCDDCKKTWPSKKNKSDEELDEDLCPECYEEPEEDDTEKVFGRLGQAQIDDDDDDDDDYRFEHGFGP
jgi:hypothetical protein